MKTLISALVSCVPLLLATGCGEITLGGGSGGSGVGATAVSSSVSSSGAPGGGYALAMRGDQAAVAMISWVSGAPSSPIDPNALALFMSNTPIDCGAPFLTDGCGVTDRWQNILIVPSETLASGHVDLRDPRVEDTSRIFFASPGVPQGCPYGASQGSQHGLLDIKASDPSSVSFDVTTTDTTGAPLVGSFTATRCGPAPTLSPPAPAIAVRGSSLTPTKGGPALDPNALYLFLGSAKETCQDPAASIACTGTSRLIAKLPASLQKVGKTGLGDAALGATFEVTEANATMNCSRYDGAYAAQQGVIGTLEVLDVKPKSLSVRVFGSFVETVGASFDVDGTYEATICD